MRLKEEADETAIVLALAGQIDLHYSPVLRSLLQGKVKARCPALILDFSEVEYIDSTGLAAIMEYRRDASDYDGVLCLAGLNARVQPIFDVVKFDQIIPIFRSAAAARAALRKGEVRPPGPGSAAA